MRATNAGGEGVGWGASTSSVVERIVAKKDECCLHNSNVLLLHVSGRRSDSDLQQSVAPTCTAMYSNRTRVLL